MIVDKIENLKQYFKPDLVDKIISFYKELTVVTADGDYPIITDNKLYCKVLSYATKQSDWITESHREYVDFQILLDGEELIEVYCSDNLVIKDIYNETKDCIFYEYPATVTPLAKVTLTTGVVGIFFPQDVHATQMTNENQVKVLKKAVFKVHKSLF